MREEIDITPVPVPIPDPLHERITLKGEITSKPGYLVETRYLALYTTMPVNETKLDSIDWFAIGVEPTWEAAFASILTLPVVTGVRIIEVPLPVAYIPAMDEGEGI